jgi:Cu/Ag efflux protein CusF
MITHFFSRSVFLPALLPLALAACVSSEPAVANPPAAPPLGVDLGGAPARRSAAVELASASPAAMPAMNPAGHGSTGGEFQMAHEGHAGAHGAGTVTAVNVAQRRIGMQHEPIPSLGWPSMAMEFAVAPSVNLQAVQPGSRVNFSIEKGPDGMYVIQSIQPAGASR